MHRRLALAALATWSATGCAQSQPRPERPARLLIGVNTRDLGGVESGVTLRQESPAEDLPLRAYTASLHFTVALRDFLYGGLDVEAGQLDARGSNFAGAYGVLGAEHGTRLGSIGVELAGGWRGLRYGRGIEDVDAYVAEPRVRGQLRLGEQVSLGAMAGASLGELGAWIAGLYLGIHSRAFGE